MALKDWKVIEANKHHIIWQNKKTNKEAVVLLDRKSFVVDGEMSKGFSSLNKLSKYMKAYMKTH